MKNKAMSKFEQWKMRDAFALAMQNQRNWATCPKHFFAPKGGAYKPGDRVTCANCGATASLHNVGDYVRGYMAAGGVATDIMPDWDGPVVPPRQEPVLIGMDMAKGDSVSIPVLVVGDEAAGEFDLAGLQRLRKLSS